MREYGLMSDAINAFVPGPRISIEGAANGPLRGLTFAAKDLFDVAGHPTGGGNHDWGRASIQCRRVMPGRCRR
jgi:amidase